MMSIRNTEGITQVIQEEDKNEEIIEEDKGDETDTL